MSFALYGRTVACLLLALGLSDCSHVPVTSMFKLARIDVTKSEPAELRAAIKLPDVLALQPRGVKMRIAVKIGSGPGESEEFALQQLADERDLASLRDEHETGTRILAYRLDTKDLPRMAAFRTAALQAKEKSGERGTLSISIRPEACRHGELPAGPILISTYLRTEETGKYVLLMRNIDVRSLDPSRDVATLITPCK